MHGNGPCGRLMAAQYAIRVVLLILVLGFCLTARSDRPYNHWLIVFVENDGEPWERKTIVIDEYYLKAALTKFYADNPGGEIRCIARDYYELCRERPPIIP